MQRKLASLALHAVNQASQIQFRKLALLGLAAVTLTACGGSSTEKPVVTPPPINQDTTADIQGQIFLPDGTTPLSNATVYVSGTSSNTALLSKTANRTCPEPDVSYEAYTCTQGDGRFTLAGLDKNNHELIAYKGAFQLSFMVDTTNAAGTTFTADPVSLDADLQQGDTKMAVVTGDYDAMQNVLAKSGFGTVDEIGQLILGTETFDIYNGNESSDFANYPGFSSLFAIDDSTGTERIHNYDIVFINCGAWEYGEDTDTGIVVPEDDHTIAVLQAFVNAGGRLYATDLAYDYIEQAFPSYIDFYADTSSPDIAESLNAAEQGDDATLIEAGTVLDTNLLTFLQNTTCTALEGEQCLNEDGTVFIEGFLSSWAIMNGAHENAEGVSFYIQADILSYDSDAPLLRPLTTAFNVGAGRVLFSSYHSEDHGDTGLFPQERILQYLIFE